MNQTRDEYNAERCRAALAHIAYITEWLTDDPHARVAYLQRVALDALQEHTP